MALAQPLWNFTPSEAKVLLASARAQLVTSYPIYTDISSCEIALQNISVCGKEGADVVGVAIGHLSLFKKAQVYRLWIGATGVGLEFDVIINTSHKLAFGTVISSGKCNEDYCFAKVRLGQTKQIMLSANCLLEIWPTCLGRSGVRSRTGNFLPLLRQRDINDNIVDKIFARTPAQQLRADFSKKAVEFRFWIWMGVS